MGEMADYCEDGALQAMADMEDRRTFNQWVIDGFRVIKGSKSVGRNEHGVPLFDRTQVWEIDETLYPEFYPDHSELY